MKKMIAVSLLLFASVLAQAAADPCMIPQIFLDSADFGVAALTLGTDQNLPSMPVPGASLTDLATGIKAMQAWGWFWICSVEQLQKKTQLQATTIASLQQQVTDLTNSANLSTALLTTQLNILLLKTPPSVSALVPTCVFVPAVPTAVPPTVATATCSFTFTSVVPTSAQILYGTVSRSYPLAGALDGTAGLLVNHNLVVTKLVPGTTYFFIARAYTAVSASGLSPKISVVAPTS